MAKYWWYTFVLAKELFTLYISLMLSAIIFCLMRQTPLRVFLLVIILIMAVFYIGFLRDAPGERINKYFVAKGVPFCKDRIIFQWVKSKRPDNDDCQGVINAAIVSTALAMKRLKPGHYRAITHEQIITMLQENYKNYTIDKIIFLRTRPINRVVKEIVGSGCERECHKTCKTFNEKKDFYYLEFTVPNKN